MTKTDLEKRVVLKCIMGSQAFGLAQAGSDIDQMAVVIPPIEQEVGLQSKFETFVPKPDPLAMGDMTYYSMRHFCKLAANGNPTILAMFWAPVIRADARGYHLRESAPLYASKRAGNAFAGYLDQQRKHLTGERGNGGHGKPRLELIEKFGFDTKFAMHMLRLGLQGIEYLTTGRMSLPMSDNDRAFLMSVREGKVKKHVCLETAQEYEKQIRLLSKTGPLPDEPNWDEIEKWLCRMYLRNWSAEQTVKDGLEYAAMIKRNGGKIHPDYQRSTEPEKELMVP